MYMELHQLIYISFFVKICQTVKMCDLTFFVFPSLSRPVCQRSLDVRGMFHARAGRRQITGRDGHVSQLPRRDFENVGHAQFGRRECGQRIA